MLKFSVPTNWDDNLIRQIDILDQERKVTEIFGKLASDFIGGGRPTYVLNNVSRRKTPHHIRLVKKTGRKFNYLLNATCLDNREFTRSGQKQIRRMLSWLDSIGVDAITVANPYLGYLIKKEYPKFELSVSAHAGVDSVTKARFWAEEIGSNKITLCGGGISRDFPLLKKIRAIANCDLQLLANEPCLYDCPFYMYHTNFIAHASQSRHILGGFGIDWCILNCRYRLFTRPEELIKATWIRPEDAGHYENIGIDSLKIIDRNRKTEDIIFALKVYLERKFDGNLIELLFYINKYPKKRLFLKNLKFFLRPLYINIFKLKKFKDLFSDIGINIDNRKLDGFLDYFLEGKCKHDGCDSCKYCSEVAEKTVVIDNVYKEKFEKKYREIMDSLTKGDMFGYF